MSQRGILTWKKKSWNHFINSECVKSGRVKTIFILNIPQTGAYWWLSMGLALGISLSPLGTLNQSSDHCKVSTIITPILQMMFRACELHITLLGPEPGLFRTPVNKQIENVYLYTFEWWVYKRHGEIYLLSGLLVA